MKPTSILAATLAALLACAAHAAAPAAPPAAPGADGRLHMCDDAPNNMELGACASAQMERADGELNAVYQALLKALPGASERKALLAAQRAWLDWRRKEADFLAQAADGFGPDGSGFGPASALRYVQLTDLRTAQLRAWARQVAQAPR